MAFDPDAYLAGGQPQGFDPDAYLASPTQSAPAQPAPAQSGQTMGDRVQNKLAEKTGQSFGQSWFVNMLDNPVGEFLIRQTAPSEEEANKAIERVKSESKKFRTGVGETALSMGSSAVAEPVAGLAGAATVPFVGVDKAVENIEGTRQAMTFQPRTEEGQEMLGGAGEALKPVGEALQTARETIGEAGYEAGGPLLGAAGQAVPDAILSAVGLKAVRAPVSRLKTRIAQDLKMASAQPELGRTIKTLADDTATGKIQPNQLPAVIKGMEDDIVSKSGESAFKRLSDLAEQAKRGNASAVEELSKAADDIGTVQADKTLAKYIAEGTEQAAKDPLAIEAMKQGFDPGVVTAAKGASAADKSKMLKMTEIMERGKKDARFAMDNRPSDIAGDSLLERVKYIRNINKEAGSQLDNVAKSLKGKPVNFQEPINNFINNLDEMGISIDNNLQPIFKGSDIEGLTGPQNAIRNVVKRLRSGKTPDAYDLHRMKKYIDENVTYGKGGEGLKGKTQNILKQLRRDLDSTLDEQFPEYNDVNTRYADTRTALDSLQDVSGRKMDLSGGNADKAVGTLLRRMMSNAQSRVNLVDAINNVESVGKKYGATFNDDIATQMLYADELDNVFGPVAKTSLAGEVGKAVKQGADMATGKKGLFETVVESVGKGAEKMRGINEEQAFKSIKEVLKR